MKLNDTNFFLAEDLHIFLYSTLKCTKYKHYEYLECNFFSVQKFPIYSSLLSMGDVIYVVRARNAMGNFCQFPPFDFPVLLYYCVIIEKECYTVQCLFYKSTSFHH